MTLQSTRLNSDWDSSSFSGLYMTVLSLNVGGFALRITAWDKSHMISQ